MVIPRLVGQALKGQPLTVFGDGKQTRTFTYVKDVVDALMGLMESPKATGELYNVGGTEEISIEDLAKKIIAMTNSDSKIEYIPYEVAFGKDFEDMERRVPGIQKIKDCIGFEPKTDLDGILKNVIDYMSRSMAPSSG
jgi:UDP-glucose 4-epimerase